jgi:hypothetical protein
MEKQESMSRVADMIPRKGRLVSSPMSRAESQLYVVDTDDHLPFPLLPLGLDSKS